MIDMINILVVDDSIENNSEKGMWEENTDHPPKNEMVVVCGQSTDVDMCEGEVVPKNEMVVVWARVRIGPLHSTQ